MVKVIRQRPHHRPPHMDSSIVFARFANADPPMLPWVQPTQHSKWHRDWFSRFCRLTMATDRQSDRQTTLHRLRSNRPRLRSTAMRPKNRSTFGV